MGLKTLNHGFQVHRNCFFGFILESNNEPNDNIYETKAIEFGKWEPSRRNYQEELYKTHLVASKWVKGNNIFSWKEGETYYLWFWEADPVGPLFGTGTVCGLTCANGNCDGPTENESMNCVKARHDDLGVFEITKFYKKDCGEETEFRIDWNGPTHKYSDAYLRVVTRLNCP